jgi:hypothetical protein
MRYAVGVLLLAVTASLSCTEGGLTRGRASELIQALDGFKRVAYLRLPIGAPFRSTFRCESQASVERDPVNQFLIKQGWVRYGTRRTTVGLGQREDCPILLLTPIGVTASAHWTQARRPYPDEAHWHLPIGDRTLIQITGLTAAPDGSTIAEFHWKWTSNKLGETLRSRRFRKPATSSNVRERLTRAVASGTMAGGVN